MATCIFATYVGGSCGPSTSNPTILECIPIEKCEKHIRSHMRAFNVRDVTIQSEAQLLLARAAICRSCRSQLKVEMESKQAAPSLPLAATSDIQSTMTPEPHQAPDSAPKVTTPFITVSPPSLMSTSDDSENDSSRSCSQDGLMQEFSRLTVDDDPSAIFSSEITSTSTDPEFHYPMSAKIMASRRKALNQFLSSCGKETYIPLHGQLLKPFNDLKPARKTTYVERACTVITAALNVIVPEDAGNLWHAVQTSKCVEKTLGIIEHSPAEKKYLEALAETYHHATTWDTRRQADQTIAIQYNSRKPQSSEPNNTMPSNDDINACAFLCIKIANRIINELYENIPETTTLVEMAEETIWFLPEEINKKRNPRKLYDVMEAYKVLVNEVFSPIKIEADRDYSTIIDTKKSQSNKENDKEKSDSANDLPPSCIADNRYNHDQGGRRDMTDRSTSTSDHE
ncbi:hypothetical protein QZH41_015561, partial [Actinostola sp. cb2023]